LTTSAWRDSVLSVHLQVPEQSWPVPSRVCAYLSCCTNVIYLKLYNKKIC